jgi:hypothetical protein
MDGASWESPVEISKASDRPSMRHSHRIRLNAAWQRSELSQSEASVWDTAQAASSTVKLPDRGVAFCDAPMALFERRFNSPTGLTPESTVVLDCGLFGCADSIRFNGLVVGGPTESRLDITELLRPHNELLLLIKKDHFSAAAEATAELVIFTE